MRGVLTPKIRQKNFLTLLACAFAIVPQFRAPKGDLSLYARTPGRNSQPSMAPGRRPRCSAARQLGGVRERSRHLRLDRPAHPRGERRRGVLHRSAWLPGHIAKKRGHPWAEAVTVGGWVTLIFGFVLWPLALIWAYVDVPARARRSRAAMIVVMLNVYLVLLFVLVQLQIVRFNLFWKVSPVIVLLLLLLGLFIPMGWGAPQGPRWWCAIRLRSCPMSPAK